MRRVEEVAEWWAAEAPVAVVAAAAAAAAAAVAAKELGCVAAPDVCVAPHVPSWSAP